MKNFVCVNSFHKFHYHHAIIIMNIYFHRKFLKLYKWILKILYKWTVFNTFSMWTNSKSSMSYKYVSDKINNSYKLIFKFVQFQVRSNIIELFRNFWLYWWVPIGQNVCLQLKKNIKMMPKLEIYHILH